METGNRIIKTETNGVIENYILNIYTKDGNSLNYCPSDGDAILFDEYYCKVLKSDGTIKEAVPNSILMSVTDIYENLRYLKLRRVLEICVDEHKKSSLIEDDKVSRYYFEELLRRIMEVINEH